MILRPQKIILIVVLAILLIGILSLYSSCHQKGEFIRKEIFHKQLLWIGVGLCLLFLLSRFDYRKISLIGVPLYLFGLMVLLFVLTMGRSIMGAQRWISWGDFSFQPSEFMKFILVLVLAKYFSRKNSQNVQMGTEGSGLFKSLILPLGITLLPTVLVLAQPDLGTAIVYLFIFFSITFLAGMPLKHFLGLLAVAVLSSPFFWHFLKDYQKSRLLVFLNPNMDPLGAGYTMIQSKIAIGSGLLFGKGWMEGTQNQLNFLPERHTDFIFSVWGEEWGFLGSLFLLTLFSILILMILRISEMAKDTHGRLLAVGFSSIFFFQVFINIAMNIGFSPVVGLPLPFISYGGSSLVVSLMAIGLVLNIARQK